jgi:hypothetical protein
LTRHLEHGGGRPVRDGRPVHHARSAEAIIYVFHFIVLFWVSPGAIEFAQTPTYLIAPVRWEARVFGFALRCLCQVTRTPRAVRNVHENEHDWAKDTTGLQHERHYRKMYSV